MFRKDLIDYLHDSPNTIRGLASVFRVKAAELEADLEHIQQSLKHTDKTLQVTPARCKKCGFQFGTDKLSKPSRCPECRSQWLSEPVVEVVSRKASVDRVDDRGQDNLG